ncbi:MAG: trigger factor [Pirellulales bacterium]|jgi:trigger factor
MSASESPSSSATETHPAPEHLDDEVVATPLALEIDVTNVSTCQRRVKVTVPREDIDRYREDAVKELVPTALLPGFRPGRAPRALVGQRFKTELADQIRTKLLSDAMEQVAEQSKLAPISEPELDVTTVLLPEEGPMIFEFGIEVRPEFELPQWKGLKIERPTREISDDDVNEALSNLLRERGRLVPSEASPAAGDLVVANVRFLDDGKEISRAEEMEIIVRPKLSFADAEFDGFEKLIASSKPGDKVTGNVTISDEAAVEEFRGKQVTMEIELVDVKRFELPELTPAVIAELGAFESEEALRTAVRQQLESRLDWHRRQRVRQQVADALTASATWELPPDLLKRQSLRELERTILELRRSGFDDDAIRRYVNQLRQSVMASTARSLKEHFILERIAEDESIAETAADYDEEIRAIAAQTSESPRRVRANLEKRGLMDVLRNQIIERKTISLIESQASFTDVPFEFEKPDADAVDHAVCGVAAGEEEIPTAKHAEAGNVRGGRR